MSHARDARCDGGKLDALFGEVAQCQLPGAVVGISVHGRPVYRKGFGLAHLELPVALTPAIRMRVGSITKHFTCLAYLLLCEAGKAGLEDPIGRYLPELHPVTHVVTARQLMGHMSGLRDAHDICWQFGGAGQPVTSSQLLALYRDIADVNFSPGTRCIYNNGGFLLLSVAIERITGCSLEEFLSRHIFEPAGMHDTLLRRWDTDFVPNSATLHMTRTGGGFEKSGLGTALCGEGGVVSTVDDLLRWLACMDRPTVGSESTWQAIRAPQQLVNGSSTGYGLGLRSGWYRGVETLGHAGSVMGGNAQILKVPCAGLDVVVLVNRQDLSAAELALKILDTCVPDLEPPTLSAESRPVVGVFRSPVTDRVAHLFERFGKQVAAIDGVDVEVMADGKGVLRPAGAYSHLKWELARAGVAALRLIDCGNPDELVQVVTAGESAPEQMAGHYRAEGLDIELTVSNTPDGLWLRSTNRFGSADYALTVLGEGVCRARSTSAMPWSGVVSFPSSYESLRFTTGRTVGLPFRRCL